MKQSTLINENFLSCNLCTKTFKDPCTIGCYHTFCRSCLTRYTKTSRDAISAKSILCPNCWQMTKVPRPQQPVDQWCQQFNMSFPIQGLLDIFASQETSGSVEHCCYACQQLGKGKQANFICEDCDVKFCDNCANLHGVIPMAADHTVSPLGAGSTPRLKKRIVMCKEHNRLIDFCCKDCQKAICNKCCVIYHRACKYVVDLDSMVPEMKRVLQQNYEEINSYSEQTGINLESKRSESEVISQHKSSLQSEIRSVSKQAVDLIRRKEKKLLDELDTLTETQMGELRGKIKSGEISLQTCQQYTEFIKLVLQSNSTMDLYDMYTLCQSGEITAALEKQNKQGIPVKEVLFEKQLNVDRLDNFFSLGHLKFEEDESHLKDTPNLLAAVSPVTADDIQPGSLTDIEVFDIGGIETLAVTDFNNSSIKSYYTIDGNPNCTSYKLDGCPWILTKTGHDRVAVSHLLHSRIELLRLTPDPILVSSIQTEKHYRCLTALSETTLAAACECPPSIDVLDLSGRVLRPVVTYSTGKWLIHDPVYMCLTSPGHIAVVDEGSVYCVTQQGEILFTRKLTEKNPGCGGVAATDTGSIIVAVYSNNKLVQLTETGQYVRDQLTGRDGIVDPGGIRVHGTKVYVTDTKNGSVKIFQL